MAIKGRFAWALFGARLLLIFSNIGALQAGYLGCKFSPSVCLEDEVCISDGLFGNCQKYEAPKNYQQFDLDEFSLKVLEGEILGLIERGYTWENPYTQCILGGVLEAVQEGGSFNRHWCQRESEEASLGDRITPEIVDTLSQYVGPINDVPQIASDYASRESPVPTEGDLGDPWRDKKDEIVKIHKYFGKKDDDKKRSYYDQDDEGRGEELSTDEMPESSYRAILEELSPQELKVLDSYLKTLEETAARADSQGQGYSEDGGQVYPGDEGQAYPEEEDQLLGSPDMETGDQGEEDQLWGPVDTRTPEYRPLEPVSAEDMMSTSEKGEDEDPGNTIESLSPEDAKLLGDLMAGTANIDELSEEQAERLNKYVKVLLDALGPEDVEDLSSTSEEEHPIMEQKKIPPEMHKKIPPDMHKKIPPMMKKEQINYKMLQGPRANARTEVQYEEKRRDPIDKDGEYPNTGKLGPKEQENLVVNPHYVMITVDPPFTSERSGMNFLSKLAGLVHVSPDVFSKIRFKGAASGAYSEVNFRVLDNSEMQNGSSVATFVDDNKAKIKNVTNYDIVEAKIGKGENAITVEEHSGNNPKYYVLTFVLCGVIAAVVIGVILIYIVRRHSRALDKLSQLTDGGGGLEPSQDYQDLCRQRMQGKASEKPEPIHASSRVASVSSQEAAVRSPSSRSSTSSWSEEPASSSMDITTGHIVLSYMEDHLKNKDRLDQEWEGLCAYEAEPNATTVAADNTNMRRNRYSDVLPYDHSRVVLSKSSNVSGSDYINASSITDHDPRNPAYIATQGPLPHTVADFWQMVWEQGSVVIVNLTKLTENGVAMCHRYWPEEGSDLYHIYEVHLVSEHIWCDDYLVRSFYLKNLQTNETRTVTQFHFLTWTDLGVPGSVKALLDFRRKVNKSYRGRSCPIMVHCSDGVGRTGTYCLIDMVLNRMGKGAKEIDIAATLEHIRDQRMGMVKTKEQFEFALAAVAEEVHAILKALPQ